MKTITEKKPRKKASKKTADIIKKMLDDKRLISEHISNGGSIEELEKKGYRFASI